MRLRLPILILMLLIMGCVRDQTRHAMRSPDGQLRARLTMIDGLPHYSVRWDTTRIINNSLLGFEARGGSEQQDLRLQFQGRQRVDATWEQPWGENRHLRDHHFEYRYRLLMAEGKQVAYDLVFRLFDDAVAFRYEFPGAAGDSLILEEEWTEFNFADDFESWWIPNDWDSYEHLYRHTPISASPGINTPVTCRTGTGIHLSIHEAALTDFAGMTLVPDEAGSLDWRAELVPWPDGVKVRTTLPHVSPWRVILIGDQAIDLANSSTILNLNEPSRITETDWITPMKYMGIWWDIHIKKHTWKAGPRHGATTANALSYIDFASANGIQGLLIEGWNLGWETWELDFTQPYPDFDLEVIAAYAESKGVELIGHHETAADAARYEREVEAAFDYYKAHGVAAVKTGYVGRIKPLGQHHHGQWMVNHYRRIVELAAEKKIMLDVHEPIKPTGIRRTWPNMMTREGVRGGEYEAWSDGNPPEHTVILPFTRGLAGPMDYTPGIFDILFERYQPDFRVHTTLAKQLALMVVLYSPLQMAADLPENYHNHPAFQFVKDLDVDVDASRVLAGEVGAYIVTARRAGETWFLGAITDADSRTISQELDFLAANRTYRAQLYLDGLDAHWETHSTAYRIETRTVTAKDRLELQLAPGGGCAITFTPLEQ